MNGHTSEWLYGIFALMLSFFSNVISWVFFICVNEERYKRIIVVSQIHISTFITYYFVEEVWVACINCAWLFVAASVVFSFWTNKYQVWFEVLVTSFGGAVLMLAAAALLHVVV